MTNNIILQKTEITWKVSFIAMNRVLGGNSGRQPSFRLSAKTGYTMEFKIFKCRCGSFYKKQLSSGHEHLSAILLCVYLHKVNIIWSSHFYFSTLKSSWSCWQAAYYAQICILSRTRLNSQRKVNVSLIKNSTLCSPAAHRKIFYKVHTLIELHEKIQVSNCVQFLQVRKSCERNHVTTHDFSINRLLPALLTTWIRSDTEKNAAIKQSIITWMMSSTHFRTPNYNLQLWLLHTVSTFVHSCNKHKIK